jgi:hypothetical protein
MTKWNEKVSIGIGTYGVTWKDPPATIDLSWYGSLSGAGRIVLSPADPSYSMDNFVMSWTKTCAEWGFPNLTQTIYYTLSIVSSKKELLKEGKGRIEITATEEIEKPPPQATVTYNREPPPPLGKSLIYGSVKDEETEAPIMAGTITGTGPTPFKVGIESGRYESGTIDPGFYTLRSWSPGYVDETYSFTVYANFNFVHDFLLKKSGIVDPNKGVIRGALIDAGTLKYIPTGRVIGSGPEPFDVISINGRYQSPEIDPGSYNVEASAAGYITQTQRAQVLFNEYTDLDFKLESTIVENKGKVAGKITDRETGNPVQDAEITVAGKTYRSSVDGLYESGDIDPGTYNVTVTHSDYESAAKGVLVEAAKVSTVDFALKLKEVVTTPFCERPPEGYGFWQPLANAIYYLFCPLVSKALGLSKSVSDFFKLIETVRTKPERIPAKLIEGLYKSKSPQVMAELAKTVAGGTKTTVQLSQVAVFDLLDDFIMNQVLPDIKKIREATERDLNDETLTESQIIDNALGNIARIYTHFYVNAWIWEMCTAGQIEALTRLIDSALAWAGLDKIVNLRMDAKIDARLKMPVMRAEDGAFKRKWFPLPDYQRMVVREKIALEDFYKKTDAMGIPRADAENFWRAHYGPPTLDDIITFNKRYPNKALPFERISIISDLDPEFQEIFEERFWEDPAIGLVRWMFETAAIKEEEVEPLVLRQHYRPEHATKIANYIIGFQVKLFRRRYILSLARLYELNKRTAEQVKSAVVEAGYTESVAEWLIKNSDLRKEIMKKAAKEAKVKEESLAMAIEMWAYDIWDESDVTEQIEELGYEEEDRPDVLELCRRKMEAKKAKLGVAG